MMAMSHSFALDSTIAWMIKHSFQMQMMTRLPGSLLAVMMTQSFKDHPGNIQAHSDGEDFDENHKKSLQHA
jgi:hypothetical protein